jgi:hypothetical protein
MKIAILIILSFYSFTILACPLGAKEDHLTIQRVMRNFGRFSREAESLTITGKDYPDSVSETTLDKGISDLSLVVSCVDAVLQNPTGDLLPSAADNLEINEKEAYIVKFIQYLNDFKNSTLYFQKLLVVEKNKPINLRNFKISYEYTKTFNEIIDRAHKEL